MVLMLMLIFDARWLGINWRWAHANCLKLRNHFDHSIDSSQLFWIIGGWRPSISRTENGGRWRVYILLVTKWGTLAWIQSFVIAFIRMKQERWQWNNFVYDNHLVRMDDSSLIGRNIHLVKNDSELVKYSLLKEVLFLFLEKKKTEIVSILLLSW